MPYGIRRRRKCDVCTNKFSTVEMRVGAIPSEEFARLAARFYQEAVALVTKNNEIENSVNKWVTK
jgi:transcriptional regulator NrdR family protein